MKTLSKRMREGKGLLGLLLLCGTLQMVNGQSVAGRENRTGKAVTNSSLIGKSLNQLLANLKNAKPAGSPDSYYATLAKIHQQGEVDLAQQGVRTGRDAKLVDAAKAMVAQGQNDVATLSKLSGQLAAGSPNAKFNDAVNQKIRAVEMDLTNEMNGKMTGDFDKDFLAAMIQHHQDGIDLAQTYLPFATKAELRSYAENVIAHNKKEIDSMKEILKK